MNIKIGCSYGNGHADFRNNKDGDRGDGDYKEGSEDDY
jgi:hypothetical protein